MYTKLEMLIGGRWIGPEDRDRIEVRNPATGEVLGLLPVATEADLDDAIAAAERGFALWREKTALDRGRIIARIGQLLRDRIDTIAPILTQEQGKPLREAAAELTSAADNFEWLAEEGKRLYGRVVPSRFANADQMVMHQPIGPVAGFAPWNFPAVLSTRKIAMALAAGCSIVLKPAEETPGIMVEIARICTAAGLPDGVLNVVFGHPARISEKLIRAPQIRKASFTGSVGVGRALAAMAGAELKPITLELGGHSPVIVMDDVDVDKVVDLSMAAKFRNAGQICMCPTRFYVHERIRARFAAAFAERAAALRVGNGLEASSAMGPLANPRRIPAMEVLTADALQGGARLLAGGRRVGGLPDAGNFWSPTVLDEVPDTARAMREEPFGPLVLVTGFEDLDDVLDRANAIDYGLASFAFTGSLRTARAIRDRIRAGSISLNTYAVTPPEMPFGGLHDSGLGVEMGQEGLLAYTNIKAVIQTDPP